jgi:AhpD family alkylhydroperoxidase
MKVQVFDPPMCCSTGVCGPAVDPDLVRFAADLDWLRRQGVDVERYNLSQQPAAFAGNDVVRGALGKDGNDCLPLTLIDDAAVCRGRYPTRDELAGYAGLELRPGIFTDAVKELVAIGAAIGSNCEMCFKYHYNEARKLGVSKEDMRLAVEMAEAVKASPARSISELAEKYLREQPTNITQSCCGPSENAVEKKPGKGSCC